MTRQFWRISAMQILSSELLRKALPALHACQNAGFNEGMLVRHYNGLNKILAISLIVVMGVLSPSKSQAHVRWFVDSENPGVTNFVPYTLTDPAVIAWIFIAVALIFAAIFLDQKLPTFPIANTKIRHDVMELMRILAGMSFLLTAYDGALVAPHLVASGAVGLAFVFLQALIGLLLLSNHFLHQAALLIILLFIGMIGQFGFLAAVEYINVIGIALFLLFNYFPSDDMRERLKPYSVDVLRIFTGIALVVLGVSEKLHGAVLGHAFIAKYQWNFMPEIGLDFFDDRLFVLSAGVMEVVFGVILILGVVTRLNTLVIAGFMLLSNIVLLIQQHKEDALLELIGHLPVISTALILLLLGYGQRLKVTNLWLKK